MRQQSGVWNKRRGNFGSRRFRQDNQGRKNFGGNQRRPNNYSKQYGRRSNNQNLNSNNQRQRNSQNRGRGSQSRNRDNNQRTQGPPRMRRAGFKKTNRGGENKQRFIKTGRKNNKLSKDVIKIARDIQRKNRMDQSLDNYWKKGEKAKEKNDDQ